jgi:hypothetical protein
MIDYFELHRSFHYTANEKSQISLSSWLLVNAVKNSNDSLSESCLRGSRSSHFCYADLKRNRPRQFQEEYVYVFIILARQLL